MRSRWTNQAGFTLIEITVAVAIVAISAAILVPNYTRMVANGRTSEVKVQLSQIYLVQKNFALENGSYTQCLRGIGVTQPTSQTYYTVGFNSSGPWPGCGPMNGSGCLFTSWTTAGVGVTSCPATDGAILANTSSGDNGLNVPTMVNIVGSTLSRDQFVAGAVANISPTTSPWDRWTIDFTKDVQHTSVGI